MQLILWIALFMLNILQAQPVQSSVLPGNTWSVENQQKLEQFLDNTQKGQLAVFDADGTLWADDVGEAFFRWLIAEHKLLHVDYTQNIYAEYERRITENKPQAYQWIVTLMAGIKESDVKQWAAHFFANYFQTRIYPAQKELVQSLQRKGAVVWIVSASNRWIIEAGAPYVGIDTTNVIGIDLEVKNGILTNQPKGPLTYKAGKVEAIKQLIAKTPAWVIGDSSGDKDMLLTSQTLSVFITHQPDPKDDMAKLATQEHWLVQYFPLLPPL